MKIQFVILVVAAAIMSNIYYEGKLVQLAFANKKYFQMAGVAVGASVLYYLVKYNPFYATKIVAASNEYMKYMPVDKNTRNFLSPLLAAAGGGGYGGGGYTPTPQASSIIGGGGGSGGGGAPRFKRAVSETKKKYVASNQNWHCGHCGTTLNHTFEVDHIVSLHNGGSNEVDNLVALCPTCHREKTAKENM